jgi:hypothetical protein
LDVEYGEPAAGDAIAEKNASRAWVIHPPSAGAIRDITTTRRYMHPDEIDSADAQDLVI